MTIGCCDLFIDSSNHDFVFSVVDFYKPPPFYHLHSDVLELLQVVEDIQPELMVMSGSCSLEASSSPNQNSVVSFKAPDHSSAQIENQFVTLFSHPPYVLHNLVTQSLEDSYLATSMEK